MPRERVSRALPDNDPKWKATAKPFIAFLCQPRSWTEIDEFTKAKRIPPFLTLNAIAWLENRKLVMSVVKDDVLCWVLRSALRSEEDTPNVPPHEEAKQEGQHKHGDAGQERAADEEEDRHTRRRRKGKERQNPAEPQRESLHREPPKSWREEIRF